MLYTKHVFQLLSLLLMTCLFTACKHGASSPNPTPADTTTADLRLSIYHGSGDTVLPFQQSIRLRGGAKITLDVVRYYLSNPVLIDSNGKRTPLAPWYHLVSLANPASCTVSLPRFTPGRYQSLELMLGVDSARNTSGAQTGALAVDSGMFWAWNTGYIHTKLEGTLARSVTGTFAWHMGGFKAPYANQRWLRLPLAAGTGLHIGARRRLCVKMQANILAVLNGPVLLQTTPYISSEPIGAEIADIWGQAFSADSVWVE